MSETQQIVPTLPPARPARAAAPGSLRVLGMVTLVYGAVLGTGTAAVDAIGMRHAGGDINTAVLAASIGCSGMLALLLVVGGVFLMRGRRGGRTLLLWFVWAVLPVMMATLIATAMLTKDAGIQVALRAAVFQFHVAMALANVGFAWIMGMMLLGRRAGEWADAGRRGVTNVPPVAAGASRLKILALLSTIFAFIPLPIVLMQIVALIFGVMSLGAIRRSRGALRGRALAITGSLASAIFLVTLCGLVAIPMALAVNVNASPRSTGQLVETRLEEMALAERLYHQMGMGHDADPFCTTTVTDLLKATKEVSPMDAVTSDKVAAADVSAVGGKGQAYLGYYFKLSRMKESGMGADAASSPDWVIFAWPAGRGAGPLMIVEASGQVTCYRARGDDPPDQVTRDEMNGWELISWRRGG